MATEQSLPAPAPAIAARRSPFSLGMADHHLLRAGLLSADALALLISFALAYLLRFKAGIPLLDTPAHSLAFYSSVAFWAVPVWLLLFALYRLYDRHYLFAGFQEYGRVIHGCTVGVLVVIVMSFLDVTLSISRGWLLLVWVLSILLVGCTRFALRRLVRRLRARGFLVAPTVIVGTNEEGRALAEQIVADGGSGARVFGFVDSSPSGQPAVVDQLPVLGDLAELEQLTTRLGITEVVVATSALSRQELLDLYRRLGRLGSVEIRLSSGLFEILTTGVKVEEISSIPLMTPHRVRITGVDAALKALLDYLVAGLGLLFLSPIMAMVALMVKWDSPGPVLHRRRVLGRAGRSFDALKFRSMVEHADQLLTIDAKLRQSFHQGYKLRNDPRVTRVGKFLRQTSLDELPQLINVLRGQMSLVGPRMVAPEEADRYGKWQLNLLTVKPGITGPWQVHGRSDIPYEERVRLSMQYIRNYTIWLDLEILLRTIPAVLGKRGAY